MDHSKYPIEIFWSEEDEEYIAVPIDLKGCSAGGLTREEAIKEVEIAMGLWLEVAAEDGDKQCQLALEVECYRLKKYIGAYAAIIGGIDAVVFTAGIGENSWVHRMKACDGLEFLGIRLDQEKNRKAIGREAGENDISSLNSTVRVFVIPTDEEVVIAVDTFAILTGEYDVHTNFRYPFEASDFVPSYLK